MKFQVHSILIALFLLAFPVGARAKFDRCKPSYSAINETTWSRLEDIKDDGRPILLISDYQRQRPGGMSRVMIHLDEFAKDLGIEIVFADADSMPELAFIEGPNNFPLGKISRPQLVGLLRRHNPQAIHLLSDASLGVLSRIHLTHLGIPYTTAFQTNVPMYLKTNYGVPKGLGAFFMRAFHRGSSGVMTPSAYAGQALADMGVKKDKIRVWDHGVDTQAFRPMTREELSPENRELFDKLKRPVILYVGRLSAEKEIDKIMGANVEGTKLIVGSGPEEARLKKLVETDPGKYRNVVFVGPKQGEDLSQFYAASDVLAFIGRYDTFGLVQYEALASGTPVAGIKGSVSDTVLSPEVGATAPTIDQAIREALLKDRKAARAFALRHTWDAASALWFDHLQRLPKDHRYWK